MPFRKKSTSSTAAAKPATIKTPKRKEIEAMIKKAATGGEKVSTAFFRDIMLHAHSKRASDVHFEPSENEAIIRYRVDGILIDKFSIPPSLHQRVIGLIKILTHMRTDEHRAAQDGRYSFEAKSGTVDVRVSLMPFSDGEKAVLRLLSSASHKLTLEELGFSETDLERVQTAIQKSWGMILATGPTGSGKTTTIYAILEIVNGRERNISTIEDPVEFYIPGVNQSQTNETTGLSFAKGLRALLRQDPDVIMVGEVRDEETAKIAVNAALTGHKLLSTLHTNNAATTIPRLLDMNIEPFLVASTLLCSIAQRLLRVTCPDCATTKQIKKSSAKSYLSPDMLRLLFGSKASVTIAQANGCEACGETGYKGRVGIYEVLMISDEIKELITARASSERIDAQARKEGMKSMLEDGVQKVLDKRTTLEELLRVMQD